jgi:acyl transferase domain-containing protein/NADPH:quinone reductase-like Zn-dependent oxidoreductase/acyl carrier protein
MAGRFSDLAPLQRAYLAIEELQSKLDAAERRRTEPIAIIGIGCRFPGGAHGPAKLWSLLRDGFDAITEVPRDRWDVDAYYDPDPSRPGKMCTRWGGFLDAVDRFDAPFFNISPREAVLMDPQQRLLLEVAWEALEDAGQPAPRLAGSRTGVFIGMYNADYAQFQDDDDAYAAIGNAMGVAAGRLSYTFDLQGPSLLVDTLCSSSLVAVSLACHSLRRRECNLALAGGVNLILSPMSTILSSRLLALAPDGRCKTFDARANGYVRSEGCGVVVLKRLSDALADGDAIWALIRGAAVNQDGRSTALTAPNVLAQQAVIRQALADGGVAPEQVGYIEAHGTGTSLGDPIEVEGLKAVYGRPRTNGATCAMASIKTNLGHTEAAAGIAGLIKTVLALKHQLIPPHLHLRELNPRIDLTGTPFVIPAEPLTWPAAGQIRFAAVSSFGLSGTNAHIVLEEAPRDAAGVDAAPTSRVSEAIHVLPLSARTPAALHALAGAYRELLDEEAPALHDLCYTASTRRTHHEVRAALRACSVEELRAELDSLLARDGSPPRRRTRLAFVFSGYGGQYVGMGRELAREEPVFRRALESCDRALRAHVHWSVLELLERDDGEWQQDIGRVQPAIFALQVALVELWRSWGIRPHAVVGHSMGEVAAAYAAGVLGLDQAAQVICCRSALLATMRGQGGTIVVDLPERDVQLAIAGEALSVAASNGPRTTLVAGDAAALSGFISQLEQQRVFHRTVQMDLGFHTPQMARLGPAMLTGLEGLTAAAGEIPFYSTVHGRLMPGTQCDATYWVENVQRPVQFWPAVQRLVEDGHHFFVEVGPHFVLGFAVADGLQMLQVDGDVRPSLRRGESERRVMLDTLGAAYERGYTVAWQTLYPSGRHLTLPTYPFQRESYWIGPLYGSKRELGNGCVATQLGEPRVASVSEPYSGPSRAQRGQRYCSPARSGGWPARPRREDATGAHPVLGAKREISVQPGTFLWEFEPDIQTWPYLADHRVEGMVVVPAAVFVELALAGARVSFGEGLHTIEKLRLQQMLVLREGTRHLVQLVIRRTHATAAEFQFASRDPHAPAVWTTHARGSFVLDDPAAKGTPETPRDEVLERCRERVSAASHYQALAAAGLQYGPTFQAVAEIWRRDGEALARLDVPAALERDDDAYVLHPALLDGCFQVLASAVPRHLAEEGALYLPVGAERIAHGSGPSAAPLWVHAHLDPGVEHDSQKVEGSLSVRDQEGHLVAEVRQFAIQRLAPQATVDPVSSWLYGIAWRRQERGAGGEAPGASIVLEATGRVRGSGWLRDTLLARGGMCESGPPARLPELLRDMRKASLHLRRVVYIADEPCGDRDAPAVALARCAELLQVVQALAQAGLRDAPRLWVVTRGARSVRSHVDEAGVSQASLWGLASTIALEHPEFACGRIDLNPTPLDDEQEELAQELCGVDGEDQIALRPGARYVARLVPRADADTDHRGVATPAGARQFTLEVTTPGILDNLVLRAASRRPPAAGEIEIAVQAAGLNFLDVLSAMGLRPGDEGDPLLLGGECAGDVVAVGEGVDDFREGDAVIAIAPSSFSRFVTTRAEFAVRKPVGVTYAQAATLPVAFLTAYYALHEVGRMRAGERILIHAASGGTGLAAVQLAQRAGVEIFATAGSPAKREFLRSLGVQHVMDSRTLRFADEVLAITNGHGVDLVLNSLTGDAIDRSLSVLAPDGRFLEIGKKDIYQDYRLGLLPFRGGLAYVAIDLAGLVRRRPAVVAGLLRTVVGQVDRGELSPLPLQTYPIADAIRAFHTMAQAQHTGKLVLTLDAATSTSIEPAVSEGVAIRGTGTYLITGGLGGVGLAIAQWLVEQGARSLALIGRRAPDPAAEVTLESLRAQGARVDVVQADAARSDALAKALALIDRTGPPLRGIVHAAAVLDDATLMRLDESSFRTVFAPKVAGAWNLHRLTDDRELDFFVLFSSAASIIGSPGQANYTAANAFLDALAHHRRARGLAALSINWGPWADVGLAAAQENRGQRLAAMGIGSIPPRLGAAAFGRLLSDPSPNVAVMDFRLRTWREVAPAAAALPLFSELVEQTGSDGRTRAATSRFRAELMTADARGRRALLEGHLVEQIAQVLRTPATRITPDTPFNTLGMDSLMGLELRNRLESSLGVSLPATLVWSHPTIAALVPHLAARLDMALEDDAQSGSAGAAVDDDVDALSEHDASALLAEKLAALDDEYRS